MTRMMNSDDKDYSENANDLRIILVGKTGAGKSATGNTILGRKDAFKAEASPGSVTSKTLKETGELQDKTVVVIDTPGLFDTSEDEKTMKAEIDRCIELSVPGPHVFLLVIKLTRFTEEEQNTVKWIQHNFGDDASKYTIVLFTGSDQLGSKKLKKFVEESKELQAIINSCGGRYHSFNNTDFEHHTQVIELMEKIKKMVGNNKDEYYTNEMFQRAQEILEWENNRLVKMIKSLPVSLRLATTPIWALPLHMLKNGRNEICIRKKLADLLWGTHTIREEIRNANESSQENILACSQPNSSSDVSVSTTDGPESVPDSRISVANYPSFSVPYAPSQATCSPPGFSSTITISIPALHFTVGAVIVCILAVISGLYLMG